MILVFVALVWIVALTVVAYGAAAHCWASNKKHEAFFVLLLAKILLVLSAVLWVQLLT